MKLLGGLEWFELVGVVSLVDKWTEGGDAWGGGGGDEVSSFVK